MFPKYELGTVSLDDRMNNDVEIPSKFIVTCHYYNFDPSNRFTNAVLTHIATKRNPRNSNNKKTVYQESSNNLLEDALKRRQFIINSTIISS